MNNETRRGRIPKSVIRDRITEILYLIGQDYGYNLYKKYAKCFGKVSMRSIYYHLSKGTELGTFRVKHIEQVAGDFSWGRDTQRVIFQLGPQARPQGHPELKAKLTP